MKPTKPNDFNVRMITSWTDSKRGTNRADAICPAIDEERGEFVTRKVSSYDARAGLLHWRGFLEM